MTPPGQHVSEYLARIHTVLHRRNEETKTTSSNPSDTESARGTYLHAVSICTKRADVRSPALSRKTYTVPNERLAWTPESGPRGYLFSLRCSTSMSQVRLSKELTTAAPWPGHPHDRPLRFSVYLEKVPTVRAN